MNLKSSVFKGRLKIQNLRKRDSSAFDDIQKL